MSFRVRKLGAYTIYLLMSGATALFVTLVFTVNMVYQVQIVGLSPLQMVLVGTALEFSIFLFEVPTGVVADVYSRRLSIIIGLFLIGLGFIIGRLASRIPVLVITAEDSKARRMWAVEMGAVGYVTKPVDGRLLARYITKVLEAG